MRIVLLPLDGGEPLAITLPITLIGTNVDCDVRLSQEGVREMQCGLAQADASASFSAIWGLQYARERPPGPSGVLLRNDEIALGGCRFRVHYEER